MYVDLRGYEARMAEVSHLEHLSVAEVPLVEGRVFKYGPDTVLDCIVGRHEGMGWNKHFQSHLNGLLLQLGFGFDRVLEDFEQLLKHFLIVADVNAKH